MPFELIGGDEGDRTPDLMNAIHALSQLSYVPKTNWDLRLVIADCSHQSANFEFSEIRAEGQGKKAGRRRVDGRR